MQILKLIPDDPQFENILAQATERLRGGGLLALPTETVYGLAADATNGEAVAKIFEIKQRPQFNPLIAHVSSVEMAQSIGNLDAVSLKIAKHFWPGPLTLVVDRIANSDIHDLVFADLDTIAMRCPGGMARQLIEQYDTPLAAPSANRSGRVSPTTAQHVATDFNGEDLLILDGGPCEVGIESTIIRVVDGKVYILRAGSISGKELADYSGLAVVNVDNDGTIQAPGMMSSHYAPRSRVIINCTKPRANAALLSFGFSGISDKFDREAQRNLSPSGDLRQAASNLYRHIRELDELGKEAICVEPIPDNGLGIAINDRLTRAAAPRPAQNGVK